MTNILESYEIYLGTVAGSLIHYTNNESNNKTIYLKSDNKCEITALSWGRKEKEILVGYKKGHCKIYNVATSNTKNIEAQENSYIVGVVPVNEDILIAANTGNIYYWTSGKCDIFLKSGDENKTVEKILINPYDENILGIGGRSNDLKLYDITTKKTVFQAKSDRHDELELAQPICINNFTYLNNISGKELATVTRQGQIRLYDTRTQRRAIKIYKNKDSVYTTVSPTYSDKEIVVGSSKGFLQVMDIRGQIKPIKTFKGYMGGLTDIVCDLEEPIVASCCLDRYFRIHNLSEKKLEFEEYLKIQTPRMLMRKRHFVVPKVEEEDIIEEIKIEDYEDSDYKKNRKRQKEQGTKNPKKVKKLIS